MPASRPSRTELRRAPAPIGSRHSPIPPGVKAGKRRAIGPGPKQLVGPSADPVAGSTLSALASNQHIDLPAAAAGRCPTATTDTSRDLSFFHQPSREEKHSGQTPTMGPSGPALSLCECAPQKQLRQGAEDRAARAFGRITVRPRNSGREKTFHVRIQAAPNMKDAMAN